MRWRSGAGAVVVSVAAVALVVLDLVDDDVRAWGVDHALTTATVTGLLVLLITVLVVDQVVDDRQARSRARAVAAQGALVLAQALRSVESVGATLDGRGSSDDARHDVRTYMLMLLVSAPVLLDDAPARGFLEEAQRLGVEMGVMSSGRTQVSPEQLTEAADRMRSAAEPLLGVLSPGERSVISGAGPA